MNRLQSLFSGHLFSAVVAGALGFLSLIYVTVKLGLSEVFLLPLAFTPIAAWMIWKSSKDPFIYIVLLVTAIYGGGVISTAVEGGLPVTPFQALLVLGIFLFLFRMLISGDFEIRLSGLEIPITAFIGIIFFSLIYSVNQASGFLEVSRIVALLIFVILTINSVYSQKHMLVLLGIGAVFGTVLAAASMITSLLNPEIAALNYLLEGRGIASRASIGDADPNFFATIFFMPVAFTAAIVHSKVKTSYRVISFILLIVLIGGALSTYSRSAWVAIFFIGAVIIYHYRNINFVVLMATLLLILLAVVPELRLALTSVFDRLINIFTGNVDASSQMRIVLGKVALQMFEDNIFFGVGFRSFPTEFSRRNLTHGMLDVNEPHNVTYMVLSELGLIGILFFLAILYLIFRMAYKNLKICRDITWQRIIAITLFSSLIGYFVFHQFIPRFFTNNTMYLNIALIVVQHHYLLNYNTSEGTVSGEPKSS